MQVRAEVPEAVHAEGPQAQRRALDAVGQDSEVFHVVSPFLGTEMRMRL
jgi:hypothetical protein